MVKGLFQAVRRRVTGDTSTAGIPEEIRRGPVEHIRMGNPWHAVSVQPGPDCCEAVGAVARRRFLSREAPALPVKHCTQVTCTCRYRHHPDRRDDNRRLHFTGTAPPHPLRRNTD